MLCSASLQQGWKSELAARFPTELVGRGWGVPEGKGLLVMALRGLFLPPLLKRGLRCRDCRRFGNGAIASVLPVCPAAEPGPAVTAGPVAQRARRHGFCRSACFREGGKKQWGNVGSHKIPGFCPSLSTPSIVTAGKGSHACFSLPRSTSQGDGFKHHLPQKTLSGHRCVGKAVGWKGK